jgi:hypothetical protein
MVTDASSTQGGVPSTSSQRLSSGPLGILCSAGKLMRMWNALVVVEGMGTAGEGSPASDASKDAIRASTRSASEAALRVQLW